MQCSANILPLHRQLDKGRRIVITEDLRLHLVWNSDRTFVKPLLRYLLSYTLWDLNLTNPQSPAGKSRERIRRAALGYLRTCYYLI